MWSLPPWERGLKHDEGDGVSALGASLPPWERGLKLYFDVTLCRQ